MRRLIVSVVLLGSLAGCGRSCVYRPGGTSRDDRIEDAISSSPECEQVRIKYESCVMSGIFDAKFFCGPSNGDCVASARARIKCRLADKDGYTCSAVAGTKMFAGRVSSECADFGKLCTGVDDNTIPYGADGGDIKKK